LTFAEKVDNGPKKPNNGLMEDFDFGCRIENLARRRASKASSRNDALIKTTPRSDSFDNASNNSSRLWIISSQVVGS
jgi:hypothetical protein